MVPIRPEAERKLRSGFQRHVDRQAERYAAQLTHAEQLAVRLECGEVAGVFGGQAGGETRRGAYVVAALPTAAIPVLIAGAAVAIPGMVPLLGATPFVAGACGVRGEAGPARLTGARPPPRAKIDVLPHGPDCQDEDVRDKLGVMATETMAIIEAGGAPTYAASASAAGVRAQR